MPDNPRVEVKPSDDLIHPAHLNEIIKPPLWTIMGSMKIYPTQREIVVVVFYPEIVPIALRYDKVGGIHFWRELMEPENGTDREPYAWRRTTVLEENNLLERAKLLNRLNTISQWFSTQNPDQRHTLTDLPQAQ